MFPSVTKYLFLFCALSLLYTCQMDNSGQHPSKWLEKNSSPTSLHFLHLAHTRMENDSFFNKAMTEINYSAFDLLLLGGDLAYYTSKNRETMDTLDQVFNFGNKNTLWSLGNHDYDNLPLIQSYTNRPPFYTFNRNDVTFLVLDTQDSLSNFVGAQMEMIQNVVDTISESTHLIVLHHKLIWMYNNEDLKDYIESISNGRLGERFHFINPNNFYPEVYPLLLEVEKKGIEVFCIGGDLGTYSKTFFYHTPEGIDFLATGFYENDPDNKVLILKYDQIKKAMDFEFVLLSDL